MRGINLKIDDIWVLDLFILKKSVEFNHAENIQHKLDNPIGAMGAI